LAAEWIIEYICNSSTRGF